MITSFEVGAIFKVIDQASPALRKVLAQVNELRAAIDKATAGMAELTKVPGLSRATSGVDALTASYRALSEQATAATSAMTRATAAARSSMPAARGGGGRAALGGRLGIGGGGGGHSFRGGAMAATGLLGYGAYQAAEMEDAVFQLIYHSGLEQNDTNRGKFRKILQDAMISSGYGLKDIAESAKQEIRMFQGTPGGGLDVLPEMLRAATIESRLKGESPEESMKALIGLAHMTKQYDPESIRKLAPAFAFLSTANPGSLGSIERAAGYAVPLLQSGLEIDPMQSLLLGTALTRAGATSTKSGTWLREMALRAMPGSALQSDKAFEKHEDALHRLGLVDDNDRPTWFTGGKPDLLKMLDVAGAHAASIPLSDRAALETQLFGKQGGGAFALLADPAVNAQVRSLREQMNSPDFKARYGGFTQAYTEGSTVQNARTALQEFNTTMMDIGAHVLPSVNLALGGFKHVLEGIRDVLPGGSKAEAKVGAGVLGGATAGAIIGGVPGAVIGGAGGGLLGVLANDAVAQGQKQDQATTDAFVKALKEAGVTGQAPEGRPAPINFSLNIDGHTLTQSVMEWITKLGTYQTSSDAPNGGAFFSP